MRNSKSSTFAWNFTKSFDKLVNAGPHSAPDPEESSVQFVRFQLKGGVGKMLRNGSGDDGVGTLDDVSCFSLEVK